MKINEKNTVPGLVVALFMMAGLVSPDVRAAGDSVELTFNYTLLQGTCDVSVDNGGLLDFSNISTDVITTKTWDPINSAAKKPFSVTLSNCSGTPDTKTRPALTLSGATETATGNTVNKSFMFVDAGSSTAKGLGFAIYKNATTSNANDLVADINSTESATRKYIDLGAVNTVAKNGTINLNAIVTCGSTCTAADKAKMRAGTLTASVTFNFVYH